jgi:hypothetical protein
MVAGLLDHERFSTFYKDAAQRVKKNGDLLSSKTTHVEFDFVAYDMGTDSSSMLVPSHTSSVASTDSRASPNAIQPTTDLASRVVDCSENLLNAFAQAPHNEQLELVFCKEAPYWIVSEVDMKHQATGYLNERIFERLPGSLQEFARMMATGRTWLETKDHWGRAKMPTADLLLRDADNFEKKVRHERDAMGAKKGASPPGDARRVVLFEIKQSGAVAYALCQLEVRVAVYLAHRQIKLENPKLVVDDVVSLAGVHVQEAVRHEVVELLMISPELKFLNRLFGLGRFEVTYPEAPPMEPSFTLPLSFDPSNSEVWVKGEGSTTPAFKVTPNGEHGERRCATVVPW